MEISILDNDEVWGRSMYCGLLPRNKLFHLKSLTKSYVCKGRCDNKDCQYQHIDPADKIKDCPWYDRGFCRHGKLDRLKFFHSKGIVSTTSKFIIVSTV